MLQNLKDISGAAVPVRVGGTTANHAIWTPDQKEAIIQNFATPGADQPANVTWGPKYLESFKVFPKGTKYTIGVTFDSGKKGEDNSATEAEAFYKGIGKDLYAIEVGNEFDGTSQHIEAIDEKSRVLILESLSCRPQHYHMVNRPICPRMALPHIRHRHPRPPQQQPQTLPSGCVCLTRHSQRRRILDCTSRHRPRYNIQRSRKNILHAPILRRGVPARQADTRRQRDESHSSDTGHAISCVRVCVFRV